MKKFRKGDNGGGNDFIRKIMVWMGIVLLMMLVYDSYMGVHMSGQKIAFSEFLNRADSGQITEVTIRGDQIEGKYSDGKQFTTLAPNYPGLVDRLSAQNIQIEVAPIDSPMGSFFGIFLSWLPLLIILGVWFYLLKQMQGGGGKAMGFGKSKAKMLTQKNNNVTFDDVAGVDEAKEDLKEIVDFLKDPSKFQKLGGKIPKGCLLVGSPGTGKTLLARAIAGEAKVPFFSISGSDFVEMFVGVGASRVRDMFEQAKKHAPCIIFIDEIDAVGRHRGAGIGGGNDEREQTLNQMLVEMDGFAANEGVIVIAATNRPDVLDPALLRPGRFDRQITVALPDIKGRTQILNVHASKAKLGPDVDLKVIARGTPGFSGADLANLINEAALIAARRNKSVITMIDLEDAKDKVMMGPERRSQVLSEEDKRLTAYHEAGHAIVTVLLPASDPIHKATIIPRGQSLGMVMRLPENDTHSKTREQYKADIAVAMGGRAAEELVFGYDKVTSGAAQDIKMATYTSRSMVAICGLSDELGPVYLGDNASNDYKKSSRIYQTIESETKKLIDEGHKTALTLLKKHRKKLDLLAKSLIEFETLTGQEIKDLMAGKKIVRVNDNDVIDIVDTPSVPRSGAQRKLRNKSGKDKVTSDKDKKIEQ